MNIFWLAKFACLHVYVHNLPANTVLLPMFRDNAQSPIMEKHGMNIIKQVTNHVNSGLIPILIVDQHVYSFANKIQRTWPNEYGKVYYTVLMVEFMLK